MFGLGAGEVLIILVFALIFIGPKKLPELAKNLGKSLREFQRAKNDFLDQMEDDSSSNEKLTGVDSKVNESTNPQASEKNS